MSWILLALPPSTETSWEYIEYTVVDSQQAMIFQVQCTVRCLTIPQFKKIDILQNVMQYHRLGSGCGSVEALANILVS